MKNFKFGVIGHHISFTLSPKIFEVIFDYAGIIGSSEILDWNFNELDSRAMELLDYDGISVTIPYKQKIIEYIDKIEEPAKMIQSVNSIYNKENILIGYNTDYKGFLYPLSNYSEKLSNSEVLLFGFGGSARAIIYVLVNNFEISHLDIAIRNMGKKEVFINELTKLYPNLKVSVKDMKDKIDYGKYILIINSTPLGGALYPEIVPFGNRPNFNSDSIYFDLNYNDNNKAIQHAKEYGIEIINSKQMLVAQAIESFKIWTSIEIPFDEIYQKVLSGVK